jgi:hypothetical protein
MASARKYFYLVSAQRHGYDQFDSIVIVARNRDEALKEATTSSSWMRFEDDQGKLTAERMDPSRYRLGERPIGSFHAG